MQELRLNTHCKKWFCSKNNAIAARNADLNLLKGREEQVIQSPQKSNACSFVPYGENFLQYVPLSSISVDSQGGKKSRLSPFR